MAITTPMLWLDGSLVETRSATMPLHGHAPQRGSLVFDVGSFHAAREGVALFRAREHVARFLRSARIVGLPVAFDEDTLVRAASAVVAECGRSEGLVRWSVYFDAAEPDLLPRSTSTHVAVAAQVLEDPPRTAPMRIATFEDARKAAPDALSPEAKVAAAYVGPMIARRRAIAAGADDVVLLDREGNLAEAPIANVFCVFAGVLTTPPLGYVLPGITRDTILALAHSEGIPVQEKAIPRAAFSGAEEAFLTATSFAIAPIGTVDGSALPNAPGPITARLASRLAASQRGEDPTFSTWVACVR
jgi:branched-chain amino acid aminotransferase